MNDEAAHYHGHRERLRKRFLEAGDESLADYELIELILFKSSSFHSCEESFGIDAFGILGARKSVLLTTTNKT